PGGRSLKKHLRQFAPSWMSQMPALLGDAERSNQAARRPAATPHRMVHELVEAIERLATEHPIVLWLEDLHWSDTSSLALLGALARRDERTRLLVIATYRPIEILGGAC